MCNTNLLQAKCQNVRHYQSKSLEYILVTLRELVLLGVHKHQLFTFAAISAEKMVKARKFTHFKGEMSARTSNTNFRTHNCQDHCIAVQLILHE